MVAQRYCSDCGQQLRPEEQVYPNCGRPDTAHVPTPEADVPLSPPPQAEADVPLPPPPQAEADVPPSPLTQAETGETASPPPREPPQEQVEEAPPPQEQAGVPPQGRSLRGEPDSVLGEHELRIEVPEGWHSRFGGERVRVQSLSATVQVGAAVVELPGTATGVALVDPREGGVRKARTSARFENAPGEYRVRNFRDEQELAAYVEGQSAAFRVTVGRVRAPRLRLEHLYWPPSERVAKRIGQLERFHRAGRIGMRPENLRGVEGTDLSTVWEPIVRGYPAVEYLRRTNDG